jgi:hypothetical protein
MQTWHHVSCIWAPATDGALMLMLSAASCFLYYTSPELSAYNVGLFVTVVDVADACLPGADV